MLQNRCQQLTFYAVIFKEGHESAGETHAQLVVMAAACHMLGKDEISAETPLLCDLLQWICTTWVTMQRVDIESPGHAVVQLAAQAEAQQR